jgi:hypothetical protein
VAIIVIWLVSFCATTVVRAQSVITAEPITVMAMRGTMVTRTLLLRSSGVITGVQVIALDLTNADGSAVLPAGMMHVMLPADTINAGGLLTVPVMFDLNNVPSGEYKGQLLVSVPGNTYDVPITVTIKDPPFAPLLILLVGVALGMWISWYRVRGKPHDSALMRMGRFRARFLAESDLGQPFRNRVDELIVDADALARGEKWDEAAKAIDQAEAVLDKWHKGCADWQAQLAYQTDLIKKISSNAVDQDSAYVRTTILALNVTTRSAPDLKEPNELRQQLDKLHDQINAYMVLRHLFEQVDKQLIPLLNTQDGLTLRQKSAAVRDRFNALTPDNQAGYDALRTDMEALVADLNHRLRNNGTETDSSTKDLSSLANGLFALVDPPPVAHAFSQATKENGARVRLRVFNIASILIALLLLASAGFIELYTNKPTFGASMWNDYFTLLAWGFGAEATRAAVTDLVHSWGVAGVNA